MTTLDDSYAGWVRLSGEDMRNKTRFIESKQRQPVDSSLGVMQTERFLQIAMASLGANTLIT